MHRKECSLSMKSNQKQQSTTNSALMDNVTLVVSFACSYSLDSHVFIQSSYASIVHLLLNQIHCSEI